MQACQRHPFCFENPTNTAASPRVLRDLIDGQRRRCALLVLVRRLVNVQLHCRSPLAAARELSVPVVFNGHSTSWYEVRSIQQLAGDLIACPQYRKERCFRVTGRCRRFSAQISSTSVCLSMCMPSKLFIVPHTNTRRRSFVRISHVPTWALVPPSPFGSA